MAEQPSPFLPDGRLTPEDALMVEALNAIALQAPVEDWGEREHVLRRKIGSNNVELRVNTKRAAKNLEIVSIEPNGEDEKVCFVRANDRRKGWQRNGATESWSIGWDGSFAEYGRNKMLIEDVMPLVRQVYYALVDNKTE